MADAFYEVNVSVPDDPVLEPWNAGHLLTNTKDEFAKRSVSKADYRENGPSFVIDKFN